MADKGWTARMATAAGAAAGTGAAQLGLGYGLGVVVWPVVPTADDSAWLGSLGWATWITASATVFGAVIASRLGDSTAARPRGPWRLALAISAGLGALVAVALIALPARNAVRADTFSPHLIAGGYALVGLALGIVVAYWAVISRPVAANLISTAAWLWALAITAIVVELTTHRASATYLTSWQFSEVTAGGRYGTIYWPSALLTVAAAAVIGLLAAVPAAGRGDRGLGAATSGAVGPLLVAASFVVLAPRLTGALGPLESAYLIAPYAVLAGLGGSAITVSIAQAGANRRARRSADFDTPATATGVATVPAADLTDHPAAPKSKTATGRAKLPTQPGPTDPPAPVRRISTPEGKEAPPATSSRASTAQGEGSAPADVAGPKVEDAGRMSLFRRRPPKDAAHPPASSTAAPPLHSDSPTVEPKGRGVFGSHETAETSSPPAEEKPSFFGRLTSRKRRGSAEKDSAGDEPDTSGSAATVAPTESAPGTSKGGTPSSATPVGKATTPSAHPTSSATSPTSATTTSPPTAPQSVTRSAPAPIPTKPPIPPSPPKSSGPAARPGPSPSGSGPKPAADPEIAQAARPARGRAKKAAPQPKSASKSTVTPPPATPTIAQINPQPPSSD